MVSSSAENVIPIYQRSASLAGVNQRAARSLIGIDNLNEFYDLARVSLEELGISGHVRFCIIDDSEVLTFGFGVDMFDFDLAIEPLVNEGVSVYEGLFIVNRRSLTLVTPCSSASNDLELVMDPLTTLCDTFQRFIDQHEEHVRKYQSFHKKQLDSAEHIKNALGCLLMLSAHLVEQGKTVTQDLLCDIAVMLPCLGLEADQEERVLTLIETSMERMKGLIDAQTNQNDDLKVILTEAIDSLTADLERPNAVKNYCMEINSIELFR